MKTFRNQKALSLTLIALAVQGLFLASLGARADGDEDVNVLTHPTNKVEIGISNTNTDKGSDKFGEYSGQGLHPNGVTSPDLIGNFDIRGGSAYDQKGGTLRWNLYGNDLGLTSREAGGSISDQGNWSIGGRFDQLRHYTTGSYETPYQGSFGGNSFSVPSTFVLPYYKTGNQLYGAQCLSPAWALANGSGANTSAQCANAANLLSSFNPVNVYTDRRTGEFNAGYEITENWGVKAEYSHLLQQGAKLTAAATSAGPYVATSSSYAYKGEEIITLLNPTNYTTDLITLSSSWKNNNSFMTASYHGSFFQDQYNGLYFNNPFVTASTGTSASFSGSDVLSTMPDNQFHQFGLSGGYDFSKTTKLVGSYSYARNTQNDAYDMTAYGTGAAGTSSLLATALPVSSLNGVVVIRHADLRLTDQYSKNLSLTAGLKINQRDNETRSNWYSYYPITTEGTFNAFNIPMSYRRIESELSGDYKLLPKQTIHVGLEDEQIRRWCNNSPTGLANYTASTQSGSYVVNSILSGGANPGCSMVPFTNEYRLVTGYKNREVENTTFNLGYTVSRRDAEVSPNFYNPMQGTYGQSPYEVPGFVAYFDGSRIEHLLKGSSSWQANDKLNMTVSGRYLRDMYNAQFGVKDSTAWSINLDGTYALDDKSSVTVFYTVQNRQLHSVSNNVNYQSSAAGLFAAGTGSSLTTYYLPWANVLNDVDNTIGVSFKKAGLMHEKLTLKGDALFSVAKSGYNTSLVPPYGTGAAPLALTSCPSSVGFAPPITGGYTCGGLPDVSSRLLQVKFSGDYKIDKSNSIFGGWTYSHLVSSDYYYNGYAFGTSTGILPTGQTAPSYSATLLYMAYRYSWQ